MPSALLSQILREQDLRQKQVGKGHRGRSNNMSIRYEISAPISPEDFADLLRRSTLAERVAIATVEKFV